MYPENAIIDMHHAYAHSSIYIFVNLALCHIEAKSFVNYYIFVSAMSFHKNQRVYSWNSVCVRSGQIVEEINNWKEKSIVRFLISHSIHTYIFPKSVNVKRVEYFLRESWLFIMFY